MCILRPRDLDLSGGAWEYRPAEHKTQYLGKDRFAYLGPRAQAVLRPWLGGDPMAPVFSPAASEAARNAARRLSRRTPMTPSQSRRKPKADPKRPKRAAYDVTSLRNAIYRAADRAFPPPAELAQRKDESKRAWLARLTPDERAKLDAWRSEHRWHPNQLRHLAATVVRREFGIEAAQLVLGHARVSTTELYAEKDRQRAAQIMAELG